MTLRNLEGYEKAHVSNEKAWVKIQQKNFISKNGNCERVSLDMFLKSNTLCLPTLGEKKLFQ